MLMTPTQFKQKYPNAYRQLAKQFRQNYKLVRRNGWVKPSGDTRPRGGGSGSGVGVAVSLILVSWAGYSDTKDLEALAKNGTFQKLVGALEDGNRVEAERLAGRLKEEMIFEWKNDKAYGRWIVAWSALSNNWVD